MRLVVNGVERALPEGTTISGLLEVLKVDPDGVAVAVQLQVVPRSQHAVFLLSEGMRVEIIQAVGGG